MVNKWLIYNNTFLKNDKFLVTVRFSPSSVIIVPFLLTTVMGVGPYTVPPFDTEKWSFNQHSLARGDVTKFHIGLVSMSFQLELLLGVPFAYNLSYRVNVIGL